MNSKSYLFNGLLSPMALLAIVLWTLVLFFNGLYGPFTFDDVLVFPSTQLSQLDYNNVMQTITMHNSGIFGRPLPILSFIANHHFLGNAPFGYKAVNLALHFINTTLVYVLISKIVELLNKSKAVGLSHKQLLTITIITTLFWAIHPLQVSSVLYIFQRMTLMSTLFSLIALLAYIYSRGSSIEDKSPPLWLFVVFPASLLLAIFSKENGILVIAYIILIELTLISGLPKPVSYRKYWTIFFQTFTALPIILAVIYFAFHVDVIMEGYASRDFTLADRLRTELVAIVFYLKLILIPNVSEMSLYHDAFPRYRHVNIVVIACGSIVFTMMLSVFLLRRKLTALAFGSGFFLAAHSLESTFLPLELVFEHRNYLALLGVALPISWFLVTSVENFNSRALRLIAIAIPIGIVSGQTYSRTLEWSDELLMNTLAVENNPASLRARTLLLTSLSNDGQHNKVDKLLVESKAIFPENPSLSLLELALRCNSDTISQEMIEHTTTLLSSQSLDQNVPNTINALLHLANINACNELTFSTVSTLSNAATNNPKKRMPNAFLGNLYAQNAQLALAEGNNAGAIKSLKKALEVVPNHPEFLIVIVSKLLDEDQPKLAATYLSRLKEINENKLSAYSNAIKSLGKKLESHAQYSEDIEDR